MPMHFMLVGALLHTTVLGVVAFFILFAASKAEGFVSLLGRLLGYWILLLAVAGLALGIASVVTGKPMMPGPWMMHHRAWDHHMGPPPPPPGEEPMDQVAPDQAAPSDQPAPAKPK